MTMMLAPRRAGSSGARRGNACERCDSGPGATASEMLRVPPVAGVTSRYALDINPGRGGGSGVLGELLGIVLLGGAVVAGATWWWITQASAQVQERVLTTGWSVVTVMTLVLTGFALIKLFTPTRGYRP
jgi:hypothetical protein